jgi:hypothetical protein
MTKNLEGIANQDKLKRMDINDGWVLPSFFVQGVSAEIRMFHKLWEVNLHA